MQIYLKILKVDKISNNPQKIIHIKDALLFITIRR